MLLSRLNLSLISLFLLDLKAVAQIGLTDRRDRMDRSERSSVGVPVTPEAELEIPSSGAIATEAEPELVILPTRKLEVSHSNGYSSFSKEPGQIFDRAAFSYSHQGPTLVDLRNLSWDLGIGSAYSTTAAAQVREERQWGRHRPTLALSWNGRAFRDEGASLEERFQGASRLGRDFTSYEAERTARSEGGLRLGDNIRVGAQSSVTVEGEFRQDHYQIGNDLDEGSLYEAAAVAWNLGFGRNRSLETKVRRSLVRYENRSLDTRQSQDVNEAESIYVQSISSLYKGGLGVRTIDGDRSGPIISLARKPDEKGEGVLRLSYLADGQSQQVLGSLRTLYRWTRQLSLTLNLEQDLNLLTAYTNDSDGGRSQVSEQTLTKAYEVIGRYDLQFSTYSLSVARNQQDYQNSTLKREEVSLAFDHRISIVDRLILIASLRHVTEEGQVFRPIDRRTVLSALDWKHYWEMGSRTLGARVFHQIGIGYERLWEGSQELERKSLTLALGQEWI